MLRAEFDRKVGLQYDLTIFRKGWSWYPPDADDPTHQHLLFEGHI